MVSKKKKKEFGISRNFHLMLGVFILVWLNSGMFTYILNFLPMVAKLLVVGLWAVMSLQSKNFRDKSVKISIPMILFLLYMQLCKSMGGDVFYKGNFQQLLYIVIISLLYAFYSEEKHSTERKVILVVLLIDLVYVGINTFVKLSVYPELSREYAAGAQNLEKVFGRKFYGIGGFGYFYSLVVIIMLLEYYILNSVKHKALVIGLITVAIILLFQGQFTIAILLAVIFMVLLYVTNKGLSQAGFIVGFICIIGVVILAMNLSEFLLWVSKISIMPEEVARKFHEMYLSTVSNDVSKGDVGARVKRYKLSFELFTKNIFIASAGKGDLGGHSTFFDILGSYGSFCILPFMFFKNWFSDVRKRFLDKRKLIINMCAIYYLYLALLNPAFMPTLIIAMFIIVPFSLDYLSFSHDIKPIENKKS